MLQINPQKTQSVSDQPPKDTKVLQINPQKIHRCFISTPKRYKGALNDIVILFIECILGSRSPLRVSSLAREANVDL